MLAYFINLLITIYSWTMIIYIVSQYFEGFPYQIRNFLASIYEPSFNFARQLLSKWMKNQQAAYSFAPLFLLLSLHLLSYLVSYTFRAIGL